MRKSEPHAAVLLDEVHAVLLRQDYAALATLAAALEQELDHPSQKLDSAALSIIQRKANRNAATLIAVQRGIRAALRQITPRSIPCPMVWRPMTAMAAAKKSGALANLPRDISLSIKSPELKPWRLVLS